MFFKSLLANVRDLQILINPLHNRVTLAAGKRTFCKLLNRLKSYNLLYRSKEMHAHGRSKAVLFMYRNSHRLPDIPGFNTYPVKYCCRTQSYAYFAQ